MMANTKHRFLRNAFTLSTSTSARPSIDKIESFRKGDTLHHSSAIIHLHISDALQIFSAAGFAVFLCEF